MRVHVSVCLEQLGRELHMNPDDLQGTGLFRQSEQEEFVDPEICQTSQLI